MQKKVNFTIPNERIMEYIFYGLVLLGIVAVFFSEPFLRYPYDMFAHLIAIDDLYYGREVSTEIHTARLIWHQAWATVFQLFNLDSTDFFLRAKIIHVVQILISFFAIYYFSYVVLRNIYNNSPRPVLKHLSLWSIFIWLSIFATFSIKYQMVWTLWYSINYQISLPFFWYITALSIVLFLEKTSLVKKIFFIVQILIISRIILQIHAMEYMYYLMHMLVFGMVYIKNIYGYAKQYYYKVIVSIIFVIVAIKTFLRDELTFMKYLEENSMSIYELILSVGDTVVNKYNRANYVVNELMYVVLFFALCMFIFVLWKEYNNPTPEIEIHDCTPSSYPRGSHKTIAEPTGATQILHKPLKYEHGTHSKNPISRFGNKKNTINLKLFMYIIISSLFIIIPLFSPLAGIFALLTKENVVHRIYFSSSLFLLLPIFMYYISSKFKWKYVLIHLGIATILYSTYSYSKVTKQRIYYKNVQSILHSFYGTYTFHLSDKNVEQIGLEIVRFEEQNPTEKEEMYFARTDIAFIMKYIYHRRKVYWKGRKKFMNYKKLYDEHVIYNKYHKILFPDNQKFPAFRPYQ